jgi:hypothetical protein
VPAPKKTTSRKIGPAKLSRRGIGVSRLPARLPSAPLPEFVEPMKAQLVDSIRVGDWIYEIKFDGYRALALRGGHETRILSRNQKDLGKKFFMPQRELRWRAAAPVLEDMKIRMAGASSADLNQDLSGTRYGGRYIDHLRRTASANKSYRFHRI